VVGVVAGFAIGLKAIGWALVMFGFVTAGALGVSTFTLTNGGFEFAHIKA